MLIRSQSKKSIVFTESIESLRINDNEYWYPSSGKKDPTAWFIETEKINLGTYDSEEKAIKVLDKIQKFYKKKQKKFQDRIIDAMNKYQDKDLLKLLYPDCCVFQMPQNDEVN